jgi:hypothetical protein
LEFWAVSSCLAFAFIPLPIQMVSVTANVPRAINFQRVFRVFIFFSLAAS